MFLCEVIAKITALGVVNYFEDAWNRFDFTVVGFSLVGFIITMSTDASAGFIAMLRVFRVARCYGWCVARGIADAAADAAVLAAGAPQRRKRPGSLLLHLRHHGHEPVRQGQEGGPPHAARQL